LTAKKLLFFVLKVKKGTEMVHDQKKVVKEAVFWEGEIVCPFFSFFFQAETDNERYPDPEILFLQGNLRSTPHEIF
jgi:hypothetical protein